MAETRKEDKKVKPGIFEELSHAVDGVCKRLMDPLVLLMLFSVFFLFSIISRHVSPHAIHSLFPLSRSPHTRGPTIGSSLRLSPGDVSMKSRFLIGAFPMSGPMGFDSLTEATQREYTLNGRIPVGKFIWPKGKGDTTAPVWTRHKVNRLVEIASRRQPDGDWLCSYGESCNRAFFAALERHPVAGMNVLVVGSIRPWLEAICLSFGANSTTTVDFTKPKANHPQVRTLTIAELDATTETFDAVFSYSSLEHDGLGRYGDPLHPYGDIERMKKIKELLKPTGKMYLGVPVGPDFLYFNAHRVYGPIRFPMLIEGWNREGTYGDDLQGCYKGNFTAKQHWCMPKGLPDGLGCYSQPVHVLSPVYAY